MGIENDSLFTTFKTRFSSSHSSFRPYLKSNSKNFPSKVEIETPTTFETKVSSSHSNFKPSLESDSKIFLSNMEINRDSEEIYDMVIIYDGGDVNGHGYEEEEI